MNQDPQAEGACSSNGAQPGLMVVLMAGPGEPWGRQRLLDALRLLETVGALDELQLRLIILGEATNWLKPGLGAPVDLSSEDIGVWRQEFLGSLDILYGININVGLCQVAARNYGVEGEARELNIALVPFTHEVVNACKRGWQLLSF